MDNIEAIQKVGRNFKAIRALDSEFEVIDETMESIIDLENTTCRCRARRISEITCKHAMACIMYKNDDPTDLLASL